MFEGMDVEVQQMKSLQQGESSSSAMNRCSVKEILGSADKTCEALAVQNQ